MITHKSMIGHRAWAIPEGYIPPASASQAPEFVSHECVCILNTGDVAAAVEIMLYFEDRDPVGPYRLTVEPRRTRHLRFNDLEEPQPVPRGLSYSSVIAASVPVVIQHTRLDSRDARVALLSTMAFPIPP